MTKRVQVLYLLFALPLVIILFLVFLPKTIFFQQNPGDISTGLIIDFLITIPVIYYLIIRKTYIPKITTLYVIIFGIILAGIIIPSDHQVVLNQIKWIVIPIIELSLVTLVGYKLFSINKSFRKKKTYQSDFYDNLVVACNEIIPGRLGRVLASEIAVFYYLFASAKKDIGNDEFTCYRTSGIGTTIAVFIMLILVETVVVHFLVNKYNSTVAWVLTFVGLYTLLQICVIVKSLRSRLTRINIVDRKLELKYGFGAQTKIPFDHIDKIEATRRSQNSESNISLSLFDIIDTHNVVIQLNTENELQKIYGIKKKFKSINIYIDDIERFIEKMNQHVSIPQ